MAGDIEDVEGWREAFEKWLPTAKHMMEVLLWAEDATKMHPVGHGGELSLILATPKEKGEDEPVVVHPTLVHWYEGGHERRGSVVNLDKLNRAIWPLPLNRPRCFKGCRILMSAVGTCAEKDKSKGRPLVDARLLRLIDMWRLATVLPVATDCNLCKQFECSGHEPHVCSICQLSWHVACATKMVALAN
eukprot:1222205-Pyramimonas_sp.AAC.1